MQKKNLYFFAHANEAIVFKKFFTDEITPNAIRRKKLNFALPKRLSSIITIYKEGIIATCGQNKNDILINVTQILTSLDGYIEQIFVLGTIGYFPSNHSLMIGDVVPIRRISLWHEYHHAPEKEVFFSSFPFAHIDLISQNTSPTTTSSMIGQLQPFAHAVDMEKYFYCEAIHRICPHIPCTVLGVISDFCKDAKKKTIIKNKLFYSTMLFETFIDNFEMETNDLDSPNPFLSENKRRIKKKLSKWLKDSNHNHPNPVSSPLFERKYKFFPNQISPYQK